MRELRWQQIDVLHEKTLTVGKSKTAAGTGRVIPLNNTVMAALQAHAARYIRRFGECKPEWYVFPAGKGQPNGPTRPVRTAWTNVRDKARVVGRGGMIRKQISEVRLSGDEGLVKLLESLFERQK